MNKPTKITVEKPEVKRNNKVSITPKRDRVKTKAVPAVDQILFLQNTIGNQAVQRLLKSATLQAKLRIGKPGDKYEREADMIADKVLRMPEMTECLECKDKGEEPLQTKPITSQITPLIRRQTEEEEEEEIQAQSEYPLLQKQTEPEEKEEEIQTKPITENIMRMSTPGCTSCGEEEENLQTKPITTQITPLIRRQSEEEEEEEEPIQAKSNSSSTAEVSSSVESSINSLKGRGQPLSESTRKYFEPLFGSDFSQVRVHTNSQAGNIAKSINAKAFTTGQDVVFNSGQYSPETSGGKHLLAHELTHVMQQSSGRSFQTQHMNKPGLVSGNIIRRNIMPPPPPRPIAVRYGPEYIHFQEGDIYGIDFDVEVISSESIDDLYNFEEREQVSDSFDHRGSFQQVRGGASLPFSEQSSGWQRASNARPDRHALPLGLIMEAAERGNGSFTIHQLDIYKRAGAEDDTANVILYSGYKVVFSVIVNPPESTEGSILLRVDKIPEACSVGSYRARPGSNDTDGTPSPIISGSIYVRGDRLYRPRHSHIIRSSRDVGSRPTSFSDKSINSFKNNNESSTGNVRTLKVKDTVQRLSITPNQPIEKRDCGFRRSVWTFALDFEAQTDGYIVQKITRRDAIKACPCFGGSSELSNYTKQDIYWEAWYVKQGAKHHYLQKGVPYAWGNTDESTNPRKPKSCGMSISSGIVKFYPIGVTGDIGKFQPVPTKEGSPNAPKGSGWTTKSKYTGGLPGTKIRPPWWNDAPIEGPEYRRAESWWRCCGDDSDYYFARQIP